LSFKKTIRVHFPDAGSSSIHLPDDLFLLVKRSLLEDFADRLQVEEVGTFQEADICIIREFSSYKGHRYAKRLMEDRVLGPFLHKLLTINTEDGPTGLLKGLYTSLPKSRYDARVHRAVPYAVNPETPSQAIPTRPYLASWRGNVRSNPIRRRLVALYGKSPGFQIEATESWFNHDQRERMHYAELMKSSSFSLCPAGWAQATNRIYESMAQSVAPVIIADEYVPPSGPDWEKVALFIPESRIKALPTILAIKLDGAEIMGREAGAAWSAFFSPKAIHRYYASSLVDLVLSPDCITTSEAERNRINSLAIRWKNGWTFPQRVLSACDRFSSRLISWRSTTP